jgi:hypothetical protein
MSWSLQACRGCTLFHCHELQHAPHPNPVPKQLATSWAVSREGFAMIRYARIVSVLALLCAVAATASANIYLDENFEGATPFVDRDWLIENLTTVPTPAIVAEKGANLRSYDNNAARQDPRPVTTTDGTVVSTRYFLGAKCLQLASNQRVGIATGTYVNNAIGEIQMFQFAVSTDAASKALAPGTIIGSYKWDWSTIDTVTVSASLILDFRVNAAHRIQVVCRNTGATLDTFNGGPGSWVLISILAEIRPDDGPSAHTGTWRAYDPLGTLYKGPNVGDEPTSFPTLLSGMHVFVNGKNEVAHVLPDAIGAGWGNDNGNPGTLDSASLGWEIKALNGGTLFVDDIYWDGGYHSDETRGFDQEQAARMKEFNWAGSEPLVPIAAVEDWSIL